ncbi:MAG TPA: hypothetical protein VNV35_01580, partial [Puia sp.]|nr:hypothetical protein [Puia sp.]
SLMPDNIGISVSYPLPGTVFHERVKSELKEKANWTDSDELRLMFRNTYSPEFYKQLHRYVHKTFRRQLALRELRRLFTRPGQLTRKGLRMAAAFGWYLTDATIAGWRLRQKTIL